MGNTLIAKRSSVPGKVPQPGDLEPGELAINLADRQIYSKTTAGTVISLGGSALLPEFIDSNPTNPAIGQQWIRLDTVGPAYSPPNLTPWGLVQIVPEPRRIGSVKAMTSVGIVQSVVVINATAFSV